MMFDLIKLGFSRVITEQVIGSWGIGLTSIRRKTRIEPPSSHHARRARLTDLARSFRVQHPR